MDLYSWQQVILQMVLDGRQIPGVLGQTPSQRMVNLGRGIRVNMGMRAGHTTLAQEILRQVPSACVVVPNDHPPHPDLQRYPKDLQPRVFVAIPQEAVGKAEIMQKMVTPLRDARVCVIDGASRISEWELEPFRCANWDLYVELG